jgi:type I restriction enzyme S subunit
MANSAEELSISKFGQIDYSVIELSEIDGRLDPGHYNREAINCVHLINSLPNIVELKQLAKIVSGPFGSTLHASAYRSSGIPFIRASNVRDLFIAGELVYISRTDHDRLRSSKVGANDIVLYKIGAGLGSIGLLTDELPDANISENMIGIRPFNKHMSPFLAVFLITEYGQRQIKRQKSFQAQPKINVTDIEKILIPVPHDDCLAKVSYLIQEAYSKREEATQTYAEAENILAKVLGTGWLRESGSKTYSASSMDILESTTFRLDAPYYGSTYGQSEQMLSRSTPLREIATIVADTIHTSEHPTKQFRYISLKSIDETTGEIREVENLLGWQAPSRARLLVRTRDILVSSLRGSIDKVAMVPDELDGAIASTGFFVVRERSNQMPAEVLLALFRAPFLRAQLERLASGAILEAVSNTEFKKIRVPIGQSQELITKVAALVRQSFRLHSQCQQHVEQAKIEVEKYVERGVRDVSPLEQQRPRSSDN